MFFRHTVMIDHGIHISCGNKKSQPRLSEFPDAVFIFPVRLAQHGYLIAMSLKKPADNGRSKGAVIHISISHNVDKIRLRPASFFHFFSVDR